MKKLKNRNGMVLSSKRGRQWIAKGGRWWGLEANDRDAKHKQGQYAVIPDHDYSAGWTVTYVNFWEQFYDRYKNTLVQSR